MGGLKDGLLEYVASSLEKFDTLVQDAEGILTGTFSAADNWRFMVILSDVLKPFCYTIIAICMLIELANVASKVDIIKWEHGLKIGVKLVLAKVCIDVAPDFLKACYAQANGWISRLSTNYQPVSAQAASAIRALDSSQIGLGEALWLAMSMLLVLLGIWACGMAIKVIAYGRMFELYVYLVVSPLPCAFFPLGDGTGGGMSRVTGKFFKSFAAICLQGVMMILCIRIFNIIIGTTITTELTALATQVGADAGTIISDISYTMLMGAVVLVMSVAKCGSWAKSLLDAM